MLAFLNMLSFGGIIAVNLAVMNLLPIPALDGGRIFFLLITTIAEKLTKKKALCVFGAFLGMVFVSGFAVDLQDRLYVGKENRIDVYVTKSPSEFLNLKFFRTGISLSSCYCQNKLLCCEPVWKFFCHNHGVLVSLKHFIIQIQVPLIFLSCNYCFQR